MSDNRPVHSVEELMGRYRGGRPSPRVLQMMGVRLSHEDHGRLSLLASTFEVPKATLARDLLRAAISEALGSIEFETHEEEARFYSELAELQEDARQSEVEDYYLSREDH